MHATTARMGGAEGAAFGEGCGRGSIVAVRLERERERERERAISVFVAAMPNWPDYDLSNHGTCIDDDCCQSQGLESSRHQSIDA